LSQSCVFYVIPNQDAIDASVQKCLPVKIATYQEIERN